MISFVAHSDGKVIVPDEPVELPEGKQLRVSIEVTAEDAPPARPRPLWLEKAIELSKRMPKGLPRDFAAQHDHYIHGTPKR